MKIRDFIGQYRNHPVLFIGTGFSLRYLENSYTWNDLLEKITFELTGNRENYLDLKASHKIDSGYDYPKIASDLEKIFNETVRNDRDGKFKDINDIFYKNMEDGIQLSRLKTYICEILGSLKRRDDIKNEIPELIKAKKNISSIITTNYDQLIEEIFDFIPLIGNDILLSEPYGSLYKIHGSVTDPRSIIISHDDYRIFDERYDLIRAQLLSLFIHNPIIFIGYSVTDQNIKNLLRVIFKYVPPNTELAEKIRSNFLLVEYDSGSDSDDVVWHDIDIEGFATTIRVNKIATDNYKQIYRQIARLNLPVSAMDIRKVQNIFKDIKLGGDIRVKVADDIDSMQNSEKILIVSSEKNVSYVYKDKRDFIISYFDIIEEKNRDIIKIIDNLTIPANEWFPSFRYSQICPELECADTIKRNQEEKILQFAEGLPTRFRVSHTSIEDVLDDDSIAASYKESAIFWTILHNNIPLGNVREYLTSLPEINTSNRRILCIYDYKTALEIQQRQGKKSTKRAK